jgi:hypothetical protein
MRWLQQHPLRLRHSGRGYACLAASHRVPFHYHRALAEFITGQVLPLSIAVHHANCDRTDNRPCNLEILTKAAHAIRHHWRHSFASVCPICFSPFHLDSLLKKDTGIFCSRHCWKEALKLYPGRVGAPGYSRDFRAWCFARFRRRQVGRA